MAAAGLVLAGMFVVGAAPEVRESRDKPRCFPASGLAPRLLTRRVGRVLLERVGVADVVAVLREKYGVPLSFVEAEAPATLTVKLNDATVEAVLASVVAQAEVYRYGLVQNHLILYSDERKYGIVVQGLAGTDLLRVEAANRLGTRLRDFEEFGSLGLPYVFGDPRHPMYTDLVSLAERGTVLEYLAGIAGQSPSAVVSISRHLGGVHTLSLGYVPQLKSLRVTAPVQTLRPGESVQLTAMGVDIDGAERDLTGKDCGTRYAVHKPEVLGVSAGGEVTARAPGRSGVSARSEGLGDTVFIEVMAGGSEAKRKQK